MIRSVAILFCMMILGEVQGQYLKYSNEFLSLGVGARSYGLGQSVVAGTKDATSAYWNPAGLMGIENKFQISLMHNEQFAGIVKHDYATVAYKADSKQVFALSFIRAGVDDIPNTLQLFQNGKIDYSKLSSFSAVDYAFIGSYARQMGNPNLSIGANVKIIRRVIGDFANAWGFGFDAGAQYKWNKWNLGLNIRDITTTFNVWSFSFSKADQDILKSTGNKVPVSSLELTAPKTTFGIGRKWEFFKGVLSVEPELNTDITFDGKKNALIQSSFFNLDPRLGLELGYKQIVFLRGGMMNLQKETDINGKTGYTVMPSIGAGLQVSDFTIDYAIANPGGSSGLPHSNIISLRIGLN